MPCRGIDALCPCSTLRLADLQPTPAGCEVTDSLKRKEEAVNQASQTLVKAVEHLAEKEGRTSEDVMQDLMNDPTTMFPMVFGAENMKQFMPDSMQECSRLLRCSVTQDTEFYCCHHEFSRCEA